MNKLTLGFIGNFSVPYTTEREREKAFQELGHTVRRFQENKTTSGDLLNEIGKLDMLIYSHTHGWEIPNLKEVFRIYKEKGVPTVSAHLDRWLWLDREKDMGQEATWFTEYIFMADASPEAAEKYDELGLNWYYLKPAVAKDQCYIAEPDRQKYPHDIVFTGSKGYHSEYPFRPQLIDFLEKTYGDRFGHYGNDGIKVLREHELNVMLASSKIVVGDSCFGGRPNYVSDRYYETRGRGGFLLHPIVEGVDYFGVGAYKTRDLESLKKQIDHFLDNEEQREIHRRVGFEHVRDNETYTDRSRKILEIIFGGKNE